MLARPWRSNAVLALLAALAAGPKPPVDPLQRDGIAVTGGAAPGYVADGVCADCHGGLQASYEQVGMARSFRRPRKGDGPEDFGAARYEHGPSRQRFELAWRGERLVFRREQIGPPGKAAGALELDVDWILGSGQHARTYLYATPGGELYQLPIAWYEQERRFGMAPGYDRPDHDGVLRRVRRECLFCHNAYPDVPAGSDAHGAPHTFPASLPEGTGCQRCHGPGAEHVRAALREPPDEAAARAAIVNPRKLPPERRDDVCFECHLQPAVELPGVRRLGRGDYSFRPGESLGDYLIQVDVDEADRSRGERFEINHHAYRLQQSRCYVASGRRLSCLTCHDPHKKPAAAERAAHFRAACLACHTAEACKRPAARAGSHGADCVACHMPKRRPQDVVHTVMTDHLIRRTPGGPELLAPLVEREPALTGISLAEPERAPPGADGELYRALAAARSGASLGAEQRLETLLARTPSPHADPWLDLARAQLRQRRYADAQATLRALLEREPGLPAAQGLLAVALAAQGKTAAAVALLTELRDEDPDTQYNLGRLLRAQGRLAESEAALRAALRSRTNFVAAFYQLGHTLRAARRSDEARLAFQRALELDPTHKDAQQALGELPLEPRGR